MHDLKPNSAGFICHWLISGPREELYTTDYFNPNQLDFEKRLREIIADDSMKEVPGSIHLGEKGLEDFPWRYYQAGNNWFVDVSKFYFLLTKVEMYAATVLCVPEKCTVKARLWTYEAVEIWVNGKKTVAITEPVYKPIKYMDFDLELNTGENNIFVRVQDMGIRDTRNIFGIQLRENFDSVTVRTPDFENVSPLISTDKELMSVIVRNDSLISEKEPSLPITVENEGIWESGCVYPIASDSALIRLSVNVNGIELRRTVENCTKHRAVYSSFATLEEHQKNYIDTIYERYKDDAGNGNRLGAVMCNICKGGLEPEDYDRIRYSFSYIEARKDCADFILSRLLKIMLKAGDKLPCNLREEIKNVALSFRYWMDEKGSDAMCFWSENHALEFYGCQLMAGKLYPDEFFLRSGRTGREQYTVANSRCREWLDSIEATQFEEFLSPGYMGVTAGALLVLVDYAESDVSERAQKVLDMLMRMMFTQTFDGSLIAPHGRIYGGVIRPYSLEFQAVYSFYNKDVPVVYDVIPVLFKLSCYTPPKDLVELMNASVNKIYQTGNAEISICKTNDYILTSAASERSDNFKGGWDGTEARKENPYETGNFSFMYVKALNEKYHGTTLFQPGVYGYQQHMWSAALSNECVVLVNHPGTTTLQATMRPGYWFGNGLMPAIRQWDNTLLSIYCLDDKHPIDFTHVYFPAHTFDEIISEDGWLFGRRRNGMISLWCSKPLKPFNDALTDCEYRAFGKNQAYVCICSDAAAEGSLDKFVQKCKNMNITFDEKKLVLNDGKNHEIKYAAKYNDSQVI